MDELHKNILKLTKDNTLFRAELITGEYCQVVLMNIPAHGEIGTEVHDVDQLLIFLEGTGEAVLEGGIRTIKPGDLVFVPAGTEHNFLNRGTGDLKLFTIYSPPEHEPGTAHRTKAEADKEHSELVE